MFKVNNNDIDILNDKESYVIDVVLMSLLLSLNMFNTIL